MSGGGGKGGSTTETIKIDPRLEEGAVETLAGALRSASLPYSPNRGVSIAALAPQTLDAQRGTDIAARAFGLPVTGRDYLPAPERTQDGLLGYSTGGLYDEGLARSLTPEQQQMRELLLQSYAASADKVSPYAPFSSLRLGSNFPMTQPRQPATKPTRRVYNDRSLNNDDSREGKG